MSVLVTGGAGCIGSHVCVVLAAGGDDVIVVDTGMRDYVHVVDFAASHIAALKRHDPDGP